jgi:WD40 repeat protein
VTAVAAPPGPFKGLSAFDDTEVDALLFFGRGRERDVLVANLLASRLTVLYGQSGVGKSSILRAGVARELRRVAPEATVVVHDAWADDQAGPLAELDAEDETYLILDQFEEYFVYSRPPDAPGTLVAELPELLRRSPRTNVLIAVREDSLAQLDAFTGRIANVFANHLRLDHLDRDAARDAIRGPLERWGELTGEEVEIEPELVEAVLDETRARRANAGGRDTADRIEAPFLQLVLERIWERERHERSRLLRLATLRRLGGAEAIVRDHLQHALDALSDDEQDVAASMFAHLVTPSGTKIAHRSGDLAEYASVREGELEPVLRALSRDRILRAVDGAGGAERYEIFHDVLAEPVLTWRSERELERERSAAERRQRRLLGLVVASLVALVFVGAIAVYAWTQRQEARHTARVALARELTASAFSQLTSDPELSLLLAREAAARERSQAVEGVLRAALIASRVRRVVRVPPRAVVRGAGAAPTDALFSPDASKLLVTGGDGSVGVYDPRGGRLLFRLADSGVATAIFGPKGQLILTGGRDGSLDLWEPGDGSFVATLGRGAPVDALAFSRDGAFAAAGGHDGFVTVWHVAQRAPTATLAAGGPVERVEFNPRERLLLSVADHRLVRIFDSIDGRQVLELPVHGRVATASFSRGGRYVVTAGSDRVARIWDAQTGTLIHAFSPAGGQLLDAELSPGGKLLATASVDGITRVYDVRSGEPAATLSGHTNYVRSVDFSPDGKSVVTGSLDGTARIAPANGGLPVVVLAGHKGPVVDARFSPDGHSVVTVSEDGTVRVWDASAEPRLHVLGVQRTPVVAAAFSADGTRVVSAGERGVARVWELRSRRQLARVTQGRQLAAARLDRHGEIALTGGGDGMARLWRVSDGRLLRTLRHHGPVTSASFSPDDRLAVTTSMDRTARLWRVSEGRLLHVLREPAPVTAAAFSPDGRLVVTAAGSAASVSDVASGRLVRHLRGHLRPIATVAFDPDGKLVLTGSEDATARLWRVSDGTSVVLRGHRDALTDAEFSRDGRLVVTSSRDHSARLWAVPTGRSLGVVGSHFGLVTAASFGPDGRWVVTAGPSSAGIWNVRSRSLLFYLRGDTDLLTSASFSPDGHTILTSSRDGTVRTYRCDLCGRLDELLALARRQLAATHRTLTPAERRRYLHD